MFNEPINRVAARLALRAFPNWGEPGPEVDIAEWTRAHLERGKWSSTEEAVLHLAAGLLGIDFYDVRFLDEDGDWAYEHRRVPGLSDVLSASFDDCRQAHVLAALELAVVGEHPTRWQWVPEVF